LSSLDVDCYPIFLEYPFFYRDLDVKCVQSIGMLLSIGDYRINTLKIHLFTILMFWVCPQLSHANTLPQIGIVAQDALSIEQEITLGRIYMNEIRYQAPIVMDPLIDLYLKDLGHRLVAYSDDVRTPFHFYMIKNNNINAFAFFGGHVIIHSGLMLMSDNESELASVVAHEIAHVTQRHLARTIQDQKRKQPLTLAGILGGILLSIASPQAGIASIVTTMTISNQSYLNFSRSHEKEADTIGIRMLARAGFNPLGASTFFDKLKSSAQAPEMLSTHPLPASRMADARRRAESYPKKKYPENLFFDLTKVRLQVRYGKTPASQLLIQFNNELKNKATLHREALQYGLALLYLKQNKIKLAQQTLAPLRKKQPHNLYYIDTQVDIFLSQKKSKEAIQLLQSMLKLKPNNVILMHNLAHVYMQSDQYEKAISVLVKLNQRLPKQLLTLESLYSAYMKNNQIDKFYLTKSKWLTIRGRYDEAIIALRKVRQLTLNNDIQQAIVAELIKQNQQALAIKKQL
jgi:predicted Zn-dependent protease